MRLITRKKTLIVLDITKTESYNCLIIHKTKKKTVTTVGGTDNLFLNVLEYTNQQATQSARTWQNYP